MAQVFAPGELATPGFFYVIHKGVALYGGRVLTSGKAWGHDMILRRQVSCLTSPRLASPSCGLAWLGLAWLGLAWRGLAWPGLAWPGLAWLGLAWLGLAWLGVT